MAMEIVDKILECEKSASEKLSSAYAESKNIIDKATSKAKEISNAAKEEALKIEASKDEEAEREKEKIINKYLKEADDVVEKMAGIAAKKQDAATQAVVKKILA